VKKAAPGSTGAGGDFLTRRLQRRISIQTGRWRFVDKRMRLSKK
jgi:hypothetical protein